MQIGDEIVYINKDNYANQYYTLNKHYVIYDVRSDFVPGHICGWFRDDTNQSLYVRDDDQDKNWVYLSLKCLRKQKLSKICSVKD